LSKSTGLGKLFQQWGGTTASLFSYTHLSHDLAIGLITALLAFIRQDLGLSYMQSGLLISAYAFTSGASQFLGGWLGDRVSQRLVMALGLCGVGLTTFAIGLVSTYHILLFALVVMGVVSGAYHPSAVSMLSSYLEEARRGRAIALYMLGGSIGFALGPVMGGWIAEMLGWRVAFIILSVPALLAVPVVLTKFRQRVFLGHGETKSVTPTENNTFTRTPRGLSSLGRVLRPVASIITLTTLIQFAAGSIMAFLPLYLVDRHGMTAAYAAMWLGIVRGGGMVGTLIGGWLSDRWGRKNSIILALGATGPVLYLLAKLPFNAVLIAVFVLFGMLMQLRQATVQPYLMDNTPPHFRATVFGIYFGLGMEGMSLLQPVVGHFMDIIGIVDVFSIIAITSVALSVLTLLIMIKPKMHYKREDN